MTSPSPPHHIVALPSRHLLQVTSLHALQLRLRSVETASSGGGLVQGLGKAESIVTYKDHGVE